MRMASRLYFHAFQSHILIFRENWENVNYDTNFGNFQSTVL